MPLRRASVTSPRSSAHRLASSSPFTFPHTDSTGLRSGEYPGSISTMSRFFWLAKYALHLLALMPRQPIPNENVLSSAKLSLQIFEEGNQAVLVVAVRLGLKEKPTALAVPSIRERCRDRHLLPIEGMDQDRRFAFGRPCTADGGPLRDAAFILEDDPAAEFSRFFFTTAQRFETHCLTASSFRSLARLAGRWSDQSSRCRIRHTCPG